MRLIRHITGFIGLCAAMAAVPVVAGGIALLAWAGGGSATSLPTVHVDTDSRVLVADDIRVFAGDRHNMLPDVEQVSVTVSDHEPLFVGVAARDDVDRFLATGATDPEGQDFWVAGSAGTSTTVDWNVEPGTWSAVVMNADGTSGVDAAVQMTIPSAPLRLAGAVLIVLGFGAGVVGVLLAVAAWGGRRPPATPAPSAVAAA